MPAALPKGQEFELVPYAKFRNTPGVKFFDVTIANSNARDLVIHEGPAVSPNNASCGAWQFYLHSHQEDNLLALSGGRTFHLVNFAWDYPFHMVRLEADGDILRIPPGTFHRSVSDAQGSIVLNQAVRDAVATVESEFRVYNSADIPRLLRVTSHSAPPPMMHGFGAIELRRVA
ncbi:MAG: redox protein [Synechococcales cyanobacterium RM1_1_8]|nr:redox protein [Synechococcales cyanobacterium RM1_1_8]